MNTFWVWWDRIGDAAWICFLLLGVLYAYRLHVLENKITHLTDRVKDHRNHISYLQQILMSERKINRKAFKALGIEVTTEEIDKGRTDGEY